MTVPAGQVRARFTDATITVYQAYPPEIAEPAVTAGRFVPPFKRDRMTWIKPSFLWMMYRYGWAAKPGQERVLAVEIMQWDPERSLRMQALPYRSLQVGAVRPGRRPVPPGMDGVHRGHHAHR